MSKAYEIDNAAFGQKAIDLIKLFGDKGNILFDGLKDKINLVEVPPQWRALMQNMQVLENVGKGFFNRRCRDERRQSG